jgi:hypothetical protein
MPSGTSLISEGDDLMRQHWGSLQSGIQDEHFFNDSLTSAGIHKQGSARIFAGPVSAISAMPASTDSGRLYLEYDTGNLMHIGGAVTRANYGGGVCITQSGGKSIGDFANKERAVYDVIAADWGPASTDTWAVLSGGSCRHVTVPSNLSGFFQINYDAQYDEVTLNSSGADQVFINVMKNAKSVYTARYGPGPSNNSIRSVTLNYILAARSGDTIRIRPWHDTNLDVAALAGRQQLSIFKVG